MIILKNTMLWGGSILCAFYFMADCFGQSMKDVFPDEEIQQRYFRKALAYSYAVNENLGLTQEQRETFLKRNSETNEIRVQAEALQIELGDQYQGPKDGDIKRMAWEELMLVMDEQQTNKVMQDFLVQYVRMQSSFKFRHGTDLVLPLQEVVYCREFADWLGVTKEQQKQLQQAKQHAEKRTSPEELAKTLSKDSPLYDPEGAQAKLLAQWQETLFDLLLPHQQSIYKEALGKEAAYMKQYHNKLSVDARIFLLDPSRISDKFGYGIETKEKPELGKLLHLTHPHLDAKIHPHALFDLLLTEDVRRDLKLSELQVNQLTQAQQSWISNNPLPDENISVRKEMGLNMTTQGMRESAKKFADQFGMYHDQVDQILNPSQRERLRQLGNQFLMSRGWLEVPLTCPEWRDYLELSRDQRSKFDQVNARFRQSDERLEWEIYQPFREIYRETEEKVSRILTEEQKKAILHFRSMSLWE